MRSTVSVRSVFSSLTEPATYGTSLMSRRAGRLKPFSLPATETRCRVLRGLQQPPNAARPAGTESFLYWSKERFGGKTTVTISHVSILLNDDDSIVPPVLVASAQVFASHYMNGALGLTAVLRQPGEGRHYLVYLSRTQVDVLGGAFGSWKRAIVEGRIGTRNERDLSGAAPPHRESGLTYFFRGCR